MKSQKIIVLNPASRGEERGAKVLNLLTSFEKRVLGVIWNGKPGWDILLSRLSERLLEKFSFSKILKIDERADIHKGLDEATINELIDQCGLVIIGIGD